MKRLAVFLAPPLACIAAALPLAGCQDDMKCERERMELNKSWSEVREAATRRKLDGVDTAAWTDIETKTELLESSFVTPEVTWDSATKAGQAVAAELPQLHADHDALAVGFRTSAESALKEQSDFEKQCR
jgi:hypothetical protein